jgi:transposase
LGLGDRTRLEAVVADGRTEQRVARRARILLAMADPDTRVQELARRMEVARTTIWELCRRCDRDGIDVVYDAPRSGRPREISPPDPRRD